MREALNENLSHAQPKHAASLAKKPRANWKSHCFELVVGRWLQKMGATAVEHDPVASNGQNTRQEGGHGKRAPGSRCRIGPAGQADRAAAARRPLASATETLASVPSR
jgi:hypothetical protein